MAKKFYLLDEEKEKFNSLSKEHIALDLNDADYCLTSDKSLFGDMVGKQILESHPERIDKLILQIEKKELLEKEPKRLTLQVLDHYNFGHYSDRISRLFESDSVEKQSEVSSLLFSLFSYLRKLYLKNLIYMPLTLDFIQKNGEVLIEVLGVCPAGLHLNDKSLSTSSIEAHIVESLLIINTRKILFKVYRDLNLPMSEVSTLWKELQSEGAELLSEEAQLLGDHFQLAKSNSELKEIKKSSYEDFITKVGGEAEEDQGLIYVKGQKVSLDEEVWQVVKGAVDDCLDDETLTFESAQEKVSEAIQLKCKLDEDVSEYIVDQLLASEKNKNQRLIAINKRLLDMLQVMKGKLKVLYDFEHMSQSEEEGFADAESEINFLKGKITQLLEKINKLENGFTYTASSETQAEDGMVVKGGMSDIEKINMLEEEKNRLQAQVEQAQERVSNLNKNLEVKLKEQQDQYEKQVSHLKNQISNLSKKSSEEGPTQENSADSSPAASKAEEKASSPDQQEEVIAKQKERIEGLEAKFQGANIKIKQLEQKLKFLNAQASSSKSGGGGNDAQLKHKFKQLTFVHEKLEENFKKVSDDLLKRKQEIQQLKLEIAQLKSGAQSQKKAS